MILASGSAARQAMLRDAGLSFRVQPAGIDEAALRARLFGRDAAEIACALAAAKAEQVSRGVGSELVLGADSLIEAANGDILEKPGTLAGLRAQLLQLRGSCHRLLSAAALARNGALLRQESSEARLFVRPFTAEWLDSYVERCGDKVLGSVGGYHIEGPGVQLFERIEGSTFVIRGLPLLPLLGWLRQLGELKE